MRAWRWLSLISLVVTLSACGGSDKPAQGVSTRTVAIPTQTAAVPTQAVAAPTQAAAAPTRAAAASTRAAAAPEALQLVSMRRTDGATWETLVVRTDGTGDLGIFIGERAGTKHHGFRLAQDELGRLKRLVYRAEHVPQAVDVGPSASSVTYVIYAGSHVFLTAKGHVPFELARLTGTLSELIDQQEGVSGA